MLKSLILPVTILIFNLNTLAQPAETDIEPEPLIPKDSLFSLLPEKIDGYTIKQQDITPDFVTPENSIIAFGLYSNNEDNSFFIQLAHFNDVEQRYQNNSWNKEVPDTNYKGYPSYNKSTPPTVSVFVEKRFELIAYKAKGEMDTTDLYNALNALDFQKLVNLVKEYRKPVDGSSKTKEGPVEEVVFNKIDCETFNEDLKEKMKKDMGTELFPWIHYLTGNESGTAKIDDEVMVFPKKGNDWLQCVNKNDILWSPMDMPMFIRRVKTIDIQPDKVIFTTETGGFDDVIMKGKVEIDSRENK